MTELKKENKNLKGQVVTSDTFEDKKDKRIEELQNENAELKEDLQNSWKQANNDNLDYCKKVIDYEERIKKLEEKISNLLSCKNCPENKGGFICQKEYENKCLAQKIQFIKELQQENAGLKAGRPEWHDLRKKPNDLPKFRHNILVTCEYRSKLKKKRETFEWDYSSDMPLHAIAWCEIPTFKE